MVTVPLAGAVQVLVSVVAEAEVKAPVWPILAHGVVPELRLAVGPLHDDESDASISRTPDRVAVTVIV